jgi:hypothetical protein
MTIRDACGNLYGVSNEEAAPKELTLTVFHHSGGVYASKIEDRENGLVMPTKLADLPAWFAALLDEVPPECRDTAEFVIEHESDYDGPGDTIVSAFYTRMETPAEAQKRVTDAAKQNAAERKRAEAREHAVLAQLQAKYGPSS